MNRILILTAALLVAAASFAFAADPESSFREGVRTQVMSNIYSVAVAFPGHLSVVSNLSVKGNTTATGTLSVVGNTSLGGTLGVTGAAALNSATVTNGLTLNSITFSRALTAQGTNNATIKGALALTVNGTNYLVDVYWPNAE